MLFRPLAAFTLAVLWTTTAYCMDIKFVQIPERVATADAVVFGTVTEIEEKTIEVQYFGMTQKAKRYVAKVKVKDDLLKKDGLKEIRVVFVGKEDQPNDGLLIPTPVLEKENDVLLFLKKRADEDFYQMPGWHGAVGMNRTFIYQTEKVEDAFHEAEDACKIMADLPKYLKSNDDKERMTAAWMQFSRYRSCTPMRTGEKLIEKEISAEETRAILDGLLVLAEKDATEFNFIAHNMRSSLPKGFVPHEGLDDYVGKVKAWMKTAPKEYRLKRCEVEAAKK
jgi:hypothetical protein